MKIQLQRLVLLVMIIFSMLLSSSVAQASSGSLSAASSLSGWFTIIWGDSVDGLATSEDFYLNTDEGNLTKLILNDDLIRPLGGVLGLNGKQITVEGAWVISKGNDNNPTTFQVVSVSLSDQSVSNANMSSAVTGSQPWISIMCKFSDIGAEPKNLAYFQGMYSSSWPGLDNYWREVSYDNINLLGSTAGGWYTLPHPRSYYIDGSSDSLGRLADDCLGMADPYVNFTDFLGINLMFNDELGGTANGGGRYMTLDGISKVWMITWLPPWGYSLLVVVDHEMGHGFGLPHMRNADQWDIMADLYANCANSTDDTYGCLGQHIIAYHKDLLGWIPPERKFTPGVGGGTTSITLEQLALPQTSNYLMAQIPIGGSTTHFYTVEARRKTGYDVKLPGEAVIIHDIDTTRWDSALIIDPDNNGNTGDAGAMWTVGETFSDLVNGISIYVSSATSTGFQVSITSPSSIPPIAFNKLSPVNSATGQPVSLNLNWGSSIGATSYEYCYDTSDDNACSSWISTGTTASVNVSGIYAGTTYYWQVRANNGFGTTYADGSSTAYWTFTTIDTTFLDVPATHWAYSWIERLYATGITTGCSTNPLRYCPEDSVTRAQMAIFLERGMHGSAFTPPAGTGTVFADVSLSYWAVNWVEKLYADGITSGCVTNPLIYCPDNPVTRSQMAVFLLRAKYGATYIPPGVGSNTGFNDVLVTHWAAAWIKQLAAEGITTGCGSGNYCPDNNVTRAEMAIFLVRTFDLP
jgi:hypothetical protein